MHVGEEQSSSSHRHCLITCGNYDRHSFNTGTLNAQRRKATSTKLGLASREGEGIFHDYLNFRFGLRRRSPGWVELIWVIDCKPPAQANRTLELAQIIRSKAPSRLTLLFCDCHCRTALGASSSAPLGRLTSVNQAGADLFPSISSATCKNYFRLRPGQLRSFRRVAWRKIRPDRFGTDSRPL
jgi:hypothetical protein